MVSVILAAIGLLGCEQRGGENPPGAAEVPKPRSPRGGEAKNYVGHWSMAFEISVFTPCGTREVWWLWPPEDLSQERLRLLREKASEADAASGQTRLFLRCRGRLSDVGHFGHLGAYERQLVLEEIVDLRPSDAGDCAADKS